MELEELAEPAAPEPGWFSGQDAPDCAPEWVDAYEV